MFDWEPNEVEIAKVCKLMNISGEVRIRRTSSQQHSGQWKGKVKRGTLRHNIVAEKHTTQEEANRILWHELAHAKQAEEAAGDAVTSREIVDRINNNPLRSRKYKYAVRPCELEAKTYEQAAQYWSLTRSMNDEIADL